VAHAGQVIEGQNGYRLRIVQTGAETDGALLEMEATYVQEGTFPPAHHHPNQDERFEVLEGTIRTILDGVERDYGAGETFEVPRGTTHQMTSAGPARVRWEARPALRLAEFFERIHGATPEGPPTAEEFPAFLAEFSHEIVFT
jgi:mannose-6-phosphate isomerase-like protein (cupin superfamily)